MAGVLGKLCRDEIHLNKVASRRRKQYTEVSVPNDQVPNYEQNGWTPIRRNRNTTRVRKPKPSDELFEDRVWMIFRNLGFTCINDDRNCKLQFNSLTKQIDILAIDTDGIFIVECRSSQGESSVSARGALEYWNGKLGDANEAIANECGRKHAKINVVVAISSQDKRPVDDQHAEEIKHKNIFLWSNKELEYIERLIQQLGFAARYQIYSLIFAGTKQGTLRRECPALMGKTGGHKFYSFLLPAKDLLKYSYVHHRDLAGIVEASDVYQRMLRKVKLKEVTKFVDDDGYFPNSIIVNFTRRPQWNKKEKYPDGTVVGTLKLPPYFGSAWVIDGQHRLYGVAQAQRHDVVLPVLAFEGLEQADQASLFVEINDNQTSVPKNLLWDLYSDIYRDSSDEKQRKLFQIAETAKHLERDGPLKGCIEIPSLPRQRSIRLSLTTVCSTIEKYSPWSNLRHPTDDSKTPENAARVINSYFDALKEIWPEEWDKASGTVLLSNNGFVVFMMVFHDIVGDMLYTQRGDLLQVTKTKELKEQLKDKYLKHVVNYLKSDEATQRGIKRGSGRGPQNDNARILDLSIQESLPDFAPPRIQDKRTELRGQPTPDVPNTEERAGKAEPVLREFVLEQLKLYYGSDKWWKQGVPGGPKKKGDEEWKKQVRRNPHLRNAESQNERKFESLGLGEIIDVVSCGSNWEGLFKDVFMDRENFKRRIQDIMALRNPISHTRTPDDQDILDGVAGLAWLSNCISRPELKPFT